MLVKKCGTLSFLATTCTLLLSFAVANSLHSSVAAMTSAHRPTWNAAKGTGASGVSIGNYMTGGAATRSRHGRDLPAHTGLKYRAGDATARVGVALDEARAALEAREREQFDAMRREREKARFGAGVTGSGGRGTSSGSGGSTAPLRINDAGAGSPSRVVSAGVGISGSSDDILAAFDDEDDDVGGPLGADDGDDGSGDDESDDEAELVAELERIRRAREEERARKEAEAVALAAKESADSAALSNPLMRRDLAGGASASAAVRQRFGDDTVFSNTHASEPELQKRFINDMIRSDFHRSFLRKFVT